MKTGKCICVDLVLGAFAVIGACGLAFGQNAKDDGLRLLSEWDSGNKSLDFAAFGHVPQKPQTQECGSTLSDATWSPAYGFYEFSCRRRVLAHAEDGKIWRFEAWACRHGMSPNLARHNASADVQQLMFSMFIQAKSDLGLSSDFVKDREYEHCVPIGSGAPPTAAPDSVQANADHALTVTAPPPVDDHTLRISVRSLDRYKVHLNFHSKNWDHEWPGGGQIYVLGDSEFHTYNLACNPGEKICYGAGRSGNYNRYWGVGISGDNGCTGCCMTCGGDYTYTLNAGPDVSSENVSNEVTDLSNALNGLAGAVGGSRGGSGGGGGSYRPPSFHPAPPMARATLPASEDIEGSVELRLEFIQENALNVAVSTLTPPRPA
jgi:hypothetical protein